MSTSTATGATAVSAQGRGGSRHRWLVLGMIALAQLMVVLDATIVNIALPSAQQDLGFSNDSRQWIVTAYSLAFGSLLLIGGRIGDFFGYRLTFTVGLVGFAAASALGGAAGNFEVLVTARALQGVFGALVAPACLSLLNLTFTEPRERAKAFGIYGAVAGMGAAVGLLLGGLLTQHLDWRWCLFVNVAIAVPVLAGALALLKGNDRADERPALDVAGALLVTAGLFSVVYGFANAETKDWGHPGTWGFLAAGVVLLAAFAWWQTRAAHPLLPMRILLDRDRAASFLSLLVAGAAMFAVFLFLTYYLQQNLAYNPVKTGEAFLPMVAGIMITAVGGNALLGPRVSPKILVPAGMALAAVALAMLTRLDMDSHYASDILPPLFLMGLGMGVLFSSAMSLGTAGVDPADAGAASASVNVVQQVGGSIGTALLSTIAARAAESYLEGKRPSPQVLAQAGIESYSAAFWWAAGLFAVGALIAAVLYRRGVPEAARTQGPVVHM
ncbi:MFS transporter [Streptacidiphilus sp. ASG 303]|uniref:MFS transporter n=1 Tax=Streptacidiphilus sp. ASG 303 TaxID=2896847 RepID=UPI001E337144|nr:MFS transporter [Streptacidiphilus sp. ASG 303]MCD0484221.1 MFS transporter [Streptacidiphilus sp. ASG 303]